MNVTPARDAFTRTVLYQKVLGSLVGKAMHRFLTAVDTNSGVVDGYLELVREFYAAGPVPGPMGDAWQNHLLHQILVDENPLTLGAGNGVLPSEVMAAAIHDLRLLQQLFRLTGPACLAMAGSRELPTWPGWPDVPTRNPAGPVFQEMAKQLSGASDWGAAVGTLVQFHAECGAGLTGQYWYLKWKQGQLHGIPEPEATSLDDLVGLQQAKDTVRRNTEQFLGGAPANNLLLYGNRGTGKSTMVRALPVLYGKQGLRLVEVSRSSAGSLTDLFRLLLRYPQRFILFLDDLSFPEDDASYQAFKSVVEGAVEQRPANVLLYATSNRRHLVPQRWSDRHTPETAEVHGQDAMEEKLSLVDRFGLTVIFPAPDQEEYLAIVQHLADHRGLRVDPDELREAALRWVLWNNQRSGRAARQFIDDYAGRRSSR